MADVSYESLQSQLGQQKIQVQASREQIEQERTAGEKGIESLRRVHPRTPPSQYFGQVKPRIEFVKGRLGELTEAEKELDVVEKQLSEQQQLLESKKDEGWKIRETSEGKFEFYKEAPVAPSPGVGAPRGDFSIRVRWMDYRSGEPVEKTVLTRASKLESTYSQIEDRGGDVLEVESLGGGRELRTPEMRTTTGGSFILWEAPQIIKEPIKNAKEIAIPALQFEGGVVPGSPLAKILGLLPSELPPEYGKYPITTPTTSYPGTTAMPHELSSLIKSPEPTTPVDIAITRTEYRIKRGGITDPTEIQAIFKTELRKKEYDIVVIEGETFIIKGTAESYEQILKKIETAKVDIKRLMTGSPSERVAGMGLWITTGMLSHEDPFGIVSGYQALRGEPEKAIETKARAIVGLPLGEPWSPERFVFLGKAATGPVGMIGITYGVSAVLGAGIGAFEATTVGKYPLLISRGVKIVGGVTKPLWTLTPAKAIEIGIGGYFGYKAVEQTIPVVAKAREEDDYGPLAGYLGSLAIYGYTGIKGYKLGKVYGYGRAEEYLYLRETYTPGTKEYIRFKAEQIVSRELYSIKPKDIKTLDLTKDTQRLTPEGVEALYGVLLAKKRVVTIGGSASAYPQVRGARLPRDIDLLVSGWKHNLKFVYTKLSKYGHAFDIHGKEFGYPGQYRRFGFLYQARQKITIRGPKGELLTVKALRASEQLFRKGITSVIKEERLRHGILPGYDFPLEGTRPVLKDIFDFVTIARSLIKDAYKGIFTGDRAVSAEHALQIFLYPEKAPSFIKGISPIKPKSFFWRSAFKMSLPTEISTITYPTIYPIGVGLGYIPSTIPSKIPSYIPSVKMEAPPYVAAYQPSDFIPGYVPTKEPSYVPTYQQPYVPPYVPTKAPPYIPVEKPPYVPTKEPPYVPTKEPPYVPIEKPPYIPTYAPPYVSTTVPPYTPPYQPPYAPGYTPTIAPPPPPPQKKIIYLPRTTYELFGHTMGQGYNVFVKERTHFKGKKVKEGKMIRLSKRPLSRTDALSLGSMAVDNSAAATFEIRPVNAMAQEPLIKLKSFDMFQDKFYMKENKYIEKPKYRIDTRGEVKGVSALGWYAEKTAKAAKKREVVARRPRARVVKERDMFDTGMDDMLINMDKIFKGAFDFGF